MAELMVALDVPELGQAIRLVERLAPLVRFFKVGFELFTAAGPPAVEEVRRLGGEVFLDLKFHDIPSTVAGAAARAVNMGACMFDLHVAGGSEMMKEAVAASRRQAEERGQRPPLVLGVTVLTSLDEAALRSEVGCWRPLGEQVAFWASLAREAGLDGLVVSPREAAAIRNRWPEAVIVTPGVRPGMEQGPGSSLETKDDQKRVMTPAGAVRAGADFVVVGRPVTRAPDPLEAAQRVWEEMRGAVEGDKT